jgi:hypothetical protein
MFMHLWVGPHNILPSDKLCSTVYGTTRAENIMALEYEDKCERQESAGHCPRGRIHINTTGLVPAL